MTVIFQLGKSVTIATCAQLAGRLANVAIPLLVIAMAGATAQTDQFFLILAISFCFYGVLANAITQATISLLISGRLALQPVQVVGSGLVITVIVSTAALLISNIFIHLPRPYILALGLLAGAGIANGLASGAWQARERFVIPGISWSLRLIPLGVWCFVDPEGQKLAWLAVGIGMADVLRCALLLGRHIPLKRRSAPGNIAKFSWLAPTYGAVILAALINGLNPIIDRIIAGLGGAGAISVLETGERIYMMLASLTTIGLATVLLPRLSRNAADRTLAQSWPAILKFVGVWNIVWLTVGWLAGTYGLKWWLNSATELTAVQSHAAQWVYWYYLPGLPFFTLALVYVKRLQALRRWRVMIITSSVSVALNLPASLILFKFLGVQGIALATTLIHVLNCTILILAAHGQKGFESRYSKNRPPERI